MKDQELSKSIKIGTTFIIIYIANYYMRNMLSVLSPAMMETSKYDKEILGTFSSVYMAAYAIGQLINGFAGDRINPKYMILVGSVISGFSAIIFPNAKFVLLKIICFAVLGYGLSMFRGPMMKVISETTKASHARVICAFFSSAGFIGTFIAGLFAMMKNYESAFMWAGFVLLIVAGAAYVVITAMEQKGLIYIKKSEIKNIKDMFGAFKADNFIFYMVVGIIAEIAASTISFWIPTYLTEQLGLDKNTANMVFVMNSVVGAASPVISVWIYNVIRNDIKIIKYSFLLSALLFASMIFVKNPLANISLLVISLFVLGFSGAMLWSVYIPSLKSTGKVSSANGILDCMDYAGAACVNFVLAKIVGMVSWNDVILIWSAIMLFGAVIAILKPVIFKEKLLK